MNTVPKPAYPAAIVPVRERMGLCKHPLRSG
jgi:hypothetical protein